MADNGWLRTFGWVAAIMMPVLGLIAGSVVLGRRDFRGIPIVVTALVMMAVWAVLLNAS